MHRTTRLIALGGLVAAFAILGYAAPPAHAWTHCGTPQAEPDCPKTTTTTSSTTSTTEAPTTTTTAAPATTTTSIFQIGDAISTVHRGGGAGPELAARKATPNPAQLPRTGAATYVIVILALACITLGAAGVALTRRP